MRTFIEVNKRYYSILLLLVALLLHSCTIEKRHYRNGFYIDWNREATEGVSVNSKDTITEKSVLPVSDQVAPTANETPALAIETLAPQEIAGVQISTALESADVPESPRSKAEKNDDPQPETHDKLNPLISWITLFGILAPIAGFVGYYLLTSPNFLAFLPLIGVLGFIYAMWLRKRYQQQIAAGSTDAKYRLSGSFHRAKIILFIFFGGELLFGLGWIIAELGGPLGFVGAMMFTSGMVIMYALAAVLLVLLLLYLFVWRKDPTGTKGRPPKHPPKGG